MTILDALKLAFKNLKQISDSPELDSEVLLAHVLKKSRAFLFANQDKKITKTQETRYKQLIKKRGRHWPVAYLTGEKEFFKLKFKVTPDTLVPRPESELLVERSLYLIHNTKYKIQNVIDVGTGSGNIIISLAKNIKSKTSFFATDTSRRALKIARQNARTHKVSGRIKFLHGNLLVPAIGNKRLATGSSIIIANLPYLSTKQLGNLTIKHEPKTALYGGKEGLKYFNELFRQIKSLRVRPGRTKQSQRDRRGLRPRDDKKENLTLLLEHDPAQKKSLTNLVKKCFPQAKLKFHKDLSGKWRVLEVAK